MKSTLLLLLSGLTFLSCQNEMTNKKDVQVTDTLIIKDTVTVKIYDSVIISNDTISIIPDNNLGNLIYNYLDLSTFSNTLRSSEEPHKKTLKDLGMEPTNLSDKQVVFDISNKWHYSFSVTHREDLTGDGLVDLVIQFWDMPFDRSCRTTPQLLTVSRFSPNGNLIAISNNPLWANDLAEANEKIAFDEFGQDADCMDDSNDATW